MRNSSFTCAHSCSDRQTRFVVSFEVQQVRKRQNADALEEKKRLCRQIDGTWGRDTQCKRPTFRKVIKNITFIERLVQNGTMRVRVTITAVSFSSSVFQVARQRTSWLHERLQRADSNCEGGGSRHALAGESRTKSFKTIRC